MFRIRAKGLSLCEQIADYPSQGSQADDDRLISAANLVQAINKRAEIGETTTLRQLHKITPLTQADALKAADDLESEGVLHIQPSLHDRFESTLTLTDAMKLALKQRKASDAA